MENNNLKKTNKNSHQANEHHLNLEKEIEKLEGDHHYSSEELHDKKFLKKLQKENKLKEKAIQKEEKAVHKQRKAITKKYSGEVLKGKIISTQDYKVDLNKYVIELVNTNKIYTTGAIKTHVLKNVNLQIERGSFVVILGPSGSGKTTLLNIISGLDLASNGDVFVEGTNLIFLKDSHLTDFRRKSIGFIFQQYNLLPHLTAKENAEVGANLSSKKENGISLNEIFSTIGLEEHVHKFPHQLSGGQQQRVSIARALAKNPSILFCDEPTGALDEVTGRIVLNVLCEINKKFKTTIIIVTHNPNISKIADSVIKIKNGEIISHEKNKVKTNASEIAWS